MDEQFLDIFGYKEWSGSVLLPSGSETLTLARVIAVHKNGFVIANGKEEMSAEVSGKFLFEAEHTEDLPTVGDWVEIQVVDPGVFAMIHAILPRKNLLKRKDPGKRSDYQLIAVILTSVLLCSPRRI